MVNTLGTKKTNKAKPTRVNKKQASRKVAHEPFKFKLSKPGVIIVSVIMLVTLVAVVYPKTEVLPIEKIRISGDFTHLDILPVESQLQQYLGQGFFSVDIQEIQQVLDQQPWVNNVSVRRLWPNQLKVSIEENQVFARWDDTHLLSTSAKVFEAKSEAFKQLPLIHGYMGQSVDLLSRFNDLQHQFNKYDLKITEMHEDNKGALNLMLENSLAISLGSEHNEHKIRNFLAVYEQQIKPRMQHIKHIDFRYSNGFAIAWKKDYLKNIGKLDSRGDRNV